MPVGRSPLTHREASVIEDLEPIAPAPPAEAGSPPDADPEMARAPGRTPRTAPDRPGTDHGRPPPPADNGDGEPPAPRSPGNGERACLACAEPNHDTRRFCVSCGAALPTLDARPRDEMPLEPHDTLWRRLTGTGVRNGEDRRTWRQKAMDAGRQRLSYHGGGYSLRSKLTAALAAVGIGGGALAMAGPWRDRVLDLIGGGVSGVSPAAAELITGQAIPGYDAAFLQDEDELTGFAVCWTQTEECDPATVRLTLDQPRVVRALSIAPGSPDAAADGPLVLRPSRIRVCAAGSCVEVTLADSTSPQTRTVDFGGTVDSVELTVLEVHPPRFTTYPIAAISEVRVIS